MRPWARRTFPVTAQTHVERRGCARALIESGVVATCHGWGPAHSLVGGKAQVNLAASTPVLSELLQVCALCNDSKVAYNEVSAVQRGAPSDAVQRMGWC